MDRRRFIGGALSLLAAPLAGEAQPAGKVYRVGFLNPGTEASARSRTDAFRQRLRELGYVEGQNLVIEWRWAEGKYDRLPQLAADLVRLNVDVLATGTNAAAQAARLATEAVPIVMVSSLGADRAGLIASFARPGGNVTGLSIDTGPEIAGKMLQLLKEAAPSVVNVFALLASGPAMRGHPWTDESGRLWVKEIDLAARASGVTLVPARLERPEDFSAAFRLMSRAEALLVDASGLNLLSRRQIIDFAAKRRLPAVYAYREFSEDGGLMSYGVALTDTFRRAAEYIDRIFRGAKPADLPVEQPAKFELVINLKTAKLLGLTIPQSLSLRADEVIQ